jgi:hypothetical protein
LQFGRFNASALFGDLRFDAQLTSGKAKPLPLQCVVSPSTAAQLQAAIVRGAALDWSAISGSCVTATSFNSTALVFVMRDGSITGSLPWHWRKNLAADAVTVTPPPSVTQLASSSTSTGTATPRPLATDDEGDLFSISVLDFMAPFFAQEFLLWPGPTWLLTFGSITLTWPNGDTWTSPERIRIRQYDVCRHIDALPKSTLHSWVGALGAEYCRYGLWDTDPPPNFHAAGNELGCHKSALEDDLSFHVRAPSHVRTKIGQNVTATISVRFEGFQKNCENWQLFDECTFDDSCQFTIFGDPVKDVRIVNTNVSFVLGSTTTLNISSPDKFYTTKIAVTWESKAVCECPSVRCQDFVAGWGQSEDTSAQCLRWKDSSPPLRIAAQPNGACVCPPAPAFSSQFCVATPSLLTPLQTCGQACVNRTACTFGTPTSQWKDAARTCLVGVTGGCHAGTQVCEEDGRCGAIDPASPTPPPTTDKSALDERRCISFGSDCRACLAQQDCELCDGVCASQGFCNAVTMKILINATDCPSAVALDPAVIALSVAGSLMIFLGIVVAVWRRMSATDLESAWKTLCAVAERVNDANELDLCYHLCWEYVIALAAVHRHLLLPVNELARTNYSAQLRDFNQRASLLFRRLIVLLRTKADFSNLAVLFDVFVAHAGELKASYVLNPLYKKANKHFRWRTFVDANDIRPCHMSINRQVIECLLTTRVVLLVVCRDFLSKECPLFELFFTLARMDLGDHSNQFSYLLDLINNHAESGNQLLMIVDQLALPWPIISEGVPPALMRNDATMQDHADAVLKKLAPIVNGCIAAAAAAAMTPVSVPTTTTAPVIVVDIASD